MSTSTTIWDEWKRLTRFLHSAHLALQREAQLWSGLELAAPEQVELLGRHGASSYSVALADHISAVGDDESLYSAVLFSSYAIVEATASDRLGIDSRELGGVEDWGSRLLKQVSKSWDDVFDGCAGAVEVAVTRNALAHGSRVIDHGAANRLLQAGSSWVEGAMPALDYDSLQSYRSRLRSLLRQGTTDARDVE
jgi:hypothetical protein